MPIHLLSAPASVFARIRCARIDCASTGPLAGSCQQERLAESGSTGCVGALFLTPGKNYAPPCRRPPHKTLQSNRKSHNSGPLVRYRSVFIGTRTLLYSGYSDKDATSTRRGRHCTAFGQRTRDWAWRAWIRDYDCEYKLPLPPPLGKFPFLTPKRTSYCLSWKLQVSHSLLPFFISSCQRTSHYSATPHENSQETPWGCKQPLSSSFPCVPSFWPLGSEPSST
jgi:hypothetical protein